MPDRSAHRAALHLRAERAFGLRAVVGSRAELLKAKRTEPAVTTPVPRVAPPVRPTPPATRPAAVREQRTVPVPVAPPSPTFASLDAFATPPLPTIEKRKLLEAMNDKEVRTCPKCRLCETRTHTVFGEGDADAKIFFIGEGPGENEDLTSRPFVGKAGQLLDKMIAGMGLRREQVFIANIVKCRPPGNRVPAPDEVATCTPYLVRQLEIVRPTVIVTLGLPAARYMLDSKLTMGKLRGTWQSWRGIKLMPTFHPSYVLRVYTPETRRAVWADLQQVMGAVGLPMGKQGEGVG